MSIIAPGILKLLGWNAAVALAGFIGGALLVYILMVRGGPPLEVWHKERLRAEFTEKKLRKGEVRTFEDYRVLEDELFQQLDTQIYGQADTGPEYALARYSAGSLADWRGHDPDWNRSFELSAANPKGGVLLLHGMSDSPYSLRVLGEALNRQGYHVIGLRLPGHGTAPSGLLRVTWEDMAAAVDLAMAHLAGKTKGLPRHIVGYSTGAPLALNHVLDQLDDGDGDSDLPESLVLISPSIGITPAAALAKWQGRLGLLPGMRKMAWNSRLPEFDPYKYNSFTTNAGDQVHRLTRSVAGRLGARSESGPIDPFPRTLVFLSAVDATVSVEAVIDNLLSRLAPGRHELVLFDINRNRVQSSIMVAEPGALTARLLEDGSLPFHLSMIVNARPDGNEVVRLKKPPFSARPTTEALEFTWPRGVVSLSHVALPFPPDDPVYGRREFAQDDILNLGDIEIRGERGLLKIPSDWLLRLRFNPFYALLEERALEWVGSGGVGAD